MRNWIIASILAVMSGATALPAAAATGGIEIVITRLGDTEARFEGSGSAGVGDGPYQNLLFENFVSNAGFLNLIDGDFGIGSAQPVFQFVNVMDVLSLAQGGGFTLEDTDAPTGSGRYGGITIPAVGASGILTALPADLPPGNQVTVGHWRVAPIPLPAAAWLLLGGLGALGAVSRKRRA